MFKNVRKYSFDVVDTVQHGGNCVNNTSYNPWLEWHIKLCIIYCKNIITYLIIQNRRKTVSNASHDKAEMNNNAIKANGKSGNKVDRLKVSENIIWNLKSRILDDK